MPKDVSMTIMIHEEVCLHENCIWRQWFLSTMASEAIVCEHKARQIQWSDLPLGRCVCNLVYSIFMRQINMMYYHNAFLNCTTGMSSGRPLLGRRHKLVTIELAWMSTMYVCLPGNHSTYYNTSAHLVADGPLRRQINSVLYCRNHKFYSGCL